MVRQLIAAALKNDPQTVIVIVSDHGFASVDHALNLAIPFLQAGLITTSTSISGAVSVSSWKAEPWSASGLAAIMLHYPVDTATLNSVQSLLKELADDPGNGIARNSTADEIRLAGGLPNALFVVALRPGFTVGGAFSGLLVSTTPVKRNAPKTAGRSRNMHASFFAMGGDVALGRDLGIIDMRQIAPTVAGLLGVSFPLQNSQR